MKRILPEFSFTDQQLNSIKTLAAECNLTQETAGILYARGIDSADKVTEFIHPDKSRFISPFKMHGMTEAVGLLTRAREEEWSVLIYGDYDCDGICASAIMRSALKDFGVDAVAYVPERKGGYGLTVAAIDSILDEFFPQLVITVDCGISCAEEVEYLKECGCEVIVTDHHEMPSLLPDCICINPKFNDEYPYDNLCGAGVAFKVACALSGKSAYKYLDITALATVADSVPLTGENRDIVAEGLKLINKSPRKCFSFFLNKLQEEVTAHTLAFTLAPRINAAGRMGDAASALNLFLSEDEKEIFDLCTKLTAYNQERQQRCDELYMSAKKKLAVQGAGGKIIMLSDDSWNNGFVGIVAARLAEEYCRPVILFVNNGGVLKGSARSVDGVNIFEALKACGEYISEFGGHSQAAGVNVTEENFPLLERAMNEYLNANYTAEDFISTIYINGGFTENYARIARELELLEPYGVGNRRPMFCLKAEACYSRPIKPASAHLTFKKGGMDFMYFSGIKQLELINSPAPKNIIFEFNVSRFKGKEYVKGFVRDIIYDSSACGCAAEYALFNQVSAMSCPPADALITYKTAGEIDGLLNGRGAGYGTLLIANDYNALKKYANTGAFGVDMFNLSSRNLADIIILAPKADCDLSGYNDIYFLDKPTGIYNQSLAGKKVTVCSDISGTDSLKGIETGREQLLQVFSYLKANSGMVECMSAEEAALTMQHPYKISFFLFALKVFEQLGLITFSGGALTINRGIKTDLSNSPLYVTVSKL